MSASLRVFVMLAVSAFVLAVAVAPAEADTAVSSRTAAAKQQISQKTEKLYKSLGVVNFYHNKGRWAVAPRHKKCWDLPNADWEKVCYQARRNLRWHSAQIPKLRAQISALRYQLMPVGNVANWMCIHSGIKNGRRVGSGEGPWNALGYVNGRVKYYGGLQMDWDFMSTYGPELLRSKGTADKWTPLEQMVVAERARSSGRGYYPWPKTARACGLI